MCDLQVRDEAAERLDIADFVDELVVAVTNTRIYAPDHPRVLASLAKLSDDLQALVGTDAPADLVLGATGDFLFYEQRPLIGASLSASRILQSLAGINSGGLAFSNWANREDFFAVVEMLGKHKIDTANHAEANGLLEQRGCTAIRFLPAYSDAALSLDGKFRALLGGGIPTVPLAVYRSLVDHLQDTMVRVCHSVALDRSETRTVVEHVLRQLRTDAGRIMSVSRYERYDAYTFGHSIRVAVLALNFAAALTDSEEVLQRIGAAALLHDVGKARVPFEILHSTRRLDPEERLEMSKHTLHGGQILLEQEHPEPVAVATAFGHHRTTDQSGYPATLHDHPLSAATRIVKICDVYEALTAIRPYKDRMSPLRAYRVMISMGRHFDLTLLRRFIDVNGLYPVGSHVQLLDGATAQVVAQTDSLLAPVVQVDGENGEPLDLSKASGRQARRIERLLVDRVI